MAESRRSDKRIRIASIVGGVVITFVVGYAAAVVYEFGGVAGWWRFWHRSHRTMISYVRDGEREVALALKGKRLPSIPGRPPATYWGPLTPDMARAMGVDPKSVIDPYFRPAEGRDWREGPVVGQVERRVRINGGDFQFFHATSGFWMIVSRGPDQELQMNEAVIAEGESEFLNPISQEQIIYPESWLQCSYDPTNGTESSGDIWRVPYPEDLNSGDGVGNDSERAQIDGSP